MSPNPVTAAATWTVAVVVDAIAIVIAAIVLLWDRTCPDGFAGCPAPDPLATARQDAWVLGLLGVVVLAVALFALIRGRWLLLLAQLALGVAVVLAAQALVPSGFAQLRRTVHLAGPAETPGTPAHLRTA